VFSILASDCDVKDLDKINYGSLEEKISSVYGSYFDDYIGQKMGASAAGRQREKADHEGYDTNVFMRWFFIPFRRAMETGNIRQEIDSAKKNILGYSEGKVFKKDVEEMVKITGWLHIEKEDMLKGIGLYAMMVDYYMKEEFEDAARKKKEITEWRKNNNI
jgi:hypothetical protein